MKKTAVIGASGYVGSHVLRKYRETFPDCIGTSYSRAQQGLVAFDLKQPDIEQLGLEQDGYEAVLISSAIPNIPWCQTNPKESYALNVKGTLELVKQLEKRSLKTLFFSSDYVFDGSIGGYTDTSPTSPITEYGRQKAEVEREIPNLTDNYAILRLSKIYGTTKNDGTLIDLLAAALKQGQSITVATDQFFSPTHVDDVITLLNYVQVHEINGLINLCHSNSLSRYQIAAKLLKALNMPETALTKTLLHDIPAMKDRPLNTSLKCSTVLDPLQPSLTSIDEAIRKVAANWA